MDNDTIIVGDKVEYASADSTLLAGFTQGTVAKIEDAGAVVDINGKPGFQEWVPMDQLAKIEDFEVQAEIPETQPIQMKNEQPMESSPTNLNVGASENPTEIAIDAKRMVIEAMGFSDLSGQLRACCLLGIAQDKMWKSAAQQVKKKLEKTMKERVKALTKWGTVKPSQAAVLDIIEKVLTENGITAYPNLVRAIFANPFAEMTGYQTRGNGPDSADQTLSEPR